MKKNFQKIALFVFAAGIFSLFNGCAFSSFQPQTGSLLLEPIAAEDVRIYTGEIDGNYKVLGSIAVDVAGKGPKAKAKLREEAAAIGANAVIKAELYKIGSFTPRTGISGVAIRVE